MSLKKKIWAAAGLFILAVIGTTVYVHSHVIAVFQPQGPIGLKERHLINTALALSLIVIIPVYAMLAGFAWKYRETNTKAKYDPSLSGSRLFETIWWGVPLTIITILAFITWNSAHQLDPFKPLSSAPAMPIQVVSLQWKWLFIYPNQKLASVNFVEFPVNTPVRFEITSDAPMNSFWIPQLGGQIYAMNGMATQLNLEATKPGNYKGASANISGAGFAAMHFIAKASSQAEFDSWVYRQQTTQKQLDNKTYAKLAAASQDLPVSYYRLADATLFNEIINKYEAPLQPASSAEGL